MRKILIIGATSAIAEATARRLAERSSTFYLAGRNTSHLEAIASDLTVRGAKEVFVGQLDLADLGAHEGLLNDALARLGTIDIALIAHGTLPNQSLCSEAPDVALREFNVNGTATIAIAGRVASMLRKGATLAVISSVAGDRGRASNYLYGSAKAAVTAFLSGLGQRLRPGNINVLTIKPGFVDTPMTSGFKKGALWAKPDAIAKGIISAIDKRKAVVYLPWFWWGIMTAIKCVPEAVFRRIKL